MTVRVRFAPSPTGYLHIGGARTAMYSYLYAKAKGGKYILRIEDTDEERSKREYETAQIEDLKWLGIQHDEGPDVGGPFAPYRQTERLDTYKNYADELIAKGHAFRCYCTAEELEAKREKAESENAAPHYDGTCRNLSKDEEAKKVAEGRAAVIRFKAPLKAYSFHDHVRGDVTFPEGMVGDFVIMRANGIPVYNYAVVIDDMMMEMTHVIRAEEHLPNTLRQLMIYEALGAKIPEFAHVSLLIGADRQKLSKRHGATSVRLYKDDHYLPQALLNYLLLLGWSHPDELDVFDIHTLGTLFDINRFTKSPAIYDIAKLNYINGQHLRLLSNEELLKESKLDIPADHPFHKQTTQWQIAALNVFKEKVNFFKEFNPFLDSLFNFEVSADDADYKEAISWETTGSIRAYLLSEVEKKKAEGKTFVEASDIDLWSNHIKGELKIKGKQLFMGMRAVLTHQGHGSELKLIIPLTPVDVLEKRLKI